MSVYPAARVTDRFGHDAEFEGIGAGASVGGLLLHMMDNVDAALSRKRAEIDKALVANGCP